MRKETILVVEDEELMLSIFRRLLEAEGHTVLTASDFDAACVTFDSNLIDVTLTDIKMPKGSGLQLLEHIKQKDPSAIVIIVTAFSSIDSAIVALRNGAFDYITKPFVNEELLQSVKNGLIQRNLLKENKSLKSRISTLQTKDGMIGASRQLQEIREMVAKVANTSVTVLILGESGTGKELVARSLHDQGKHPDEPFVAINCGALPEQLLENELFGHVKGAFTGAANDYKGLLLSAGKGTILLDEIGEMTLTLQVKLLRAIQEKEVTSLGSTTPSKFNARIIASTNRDLSKLVSNGDFREDLYYRLNVVEIIVPPLRDRRSDIPMLINYFIKRICVREEISPPHLEKSFLVALTTYSWPGNIRELENVLERAVLLGGSSISSRDLQENIVNLKISDQENDLSLECIEQDHIKKILTLVDNDKPAAANILGIDLSTLYRKLKKLE